MSRLWRRDAGARPGLNTVRMCIVKRNVYGHFDFPLAVTNPGRCERVNECCHLTAPGYYTFTVSVAQDGGGRS